MTGSRPLIYITVGEPSGDQLGAHLVKALREQTGGQIDFAGLAGESMEALGLESLFPTRELALMGLDMIPHLRHLLGRIRQTVDDIEARQPAALVLVDAQGFSAHVGSAVRRRLDIPIIQYVAPTVWAYKPGRARKVSRYLDRVLSIFPFEAPYFAPHGLEATFVGHPAAERHGKSEDGAAYRRERGIPAEAHVLCVLPGSRQAEIRRNLPVIADASHRLAKKCTNLHCLLPTVSAVAAPVEAAVSAWRVPVELVHGAADKYRAFAASDVALATSGTVTVETAFARLPTVVVYKANPLLARLVRVLNLLKVSYASGVNLVLDRPALPEFIQWYAQPAPVAEAVWRLFSDPDARNRMLADMDEAASMLTSGGEAPSQVAARAILEEIDTYPRGRRAAGAMPGTSRP